MSLAKRAYQLVKSGKSLPNCICTELIMQCKIHKLAALEFTKGPALRIVGRPPQILYRVEVFFIDEEKDHVYSDGGFTTIYENVAKKRIEKMRNYFKDGVPIFLKSKCRKIYEEKQVRNELNGED